jgi:hypothetical protein
MQDTVGVLYPKDRFRLHRAAPTQVRDIRPPSEAQQLQNFNTRQESLARGSGVADAKIWNEEDVWPRWTGVKIQTAKSP